ncbi:RNA-guided endonuclease InsQ/TnpB family protein [Glycomyces dulcitolivorans]|uniref:RNA-guided endonuclease InsQ/TnpB family protein n=1 Tax=Glycomyces dulcitolivorans TaxID=2200759 RepID=UPI0018E53612|nr:RNA-guided endonuclease TnpB family protein [Glycomyces dulcitolivorans]
MLTGRRYRLELDEQQRVFAESIGDAVRYLWNVALEQHRHYRARGRFISYTEQCRQLTEARAEFDWLRAIPVHCLQQVLKDLGEACRRHGARRVHWKSRSKCAPAFRFPDGSRITVEKLNRKWARVKLPKFGWVTFRHSRPLGGVIKSATLIRDGNRWFVSFLVDDGLSTPAHGKPGTATGLDRGVATAAVTAEGEFFDRRHAGPRTVSSPEPPVQPTSGKPKDYLSVGEMERLVRLQRVLARCQRGSARRRQVKEQIANLYRRARLRRADFNAQSAARLTRDFALIGLEQLSTRAMTASAVGSLEQPGVNVVQKRGLNRAILNKGWRGLEAALRSKARYTGTRIILVSAVGTSRTCSAPGCGNVDARSRESQARFVCTSCGFTEHADVNAARNVKYRTLLAAGPAVPGRGDLQASAGSANRQLPENLSRLTGNPPATFGGGGQL